MNYKISSFFIDHGFRQKDIDKALIYEDICRKKETTRKRLYLDLKMRPNNISFAVQELLDSDLIIEDDAIKSLKQGRPEIVIKPNIDKLVSLAVWVESSQLSVAVIDIYGRIRNKNTGKVPQNVNNVQFLDILISQIDDLLNQISGRQKILGIGLSLPGTVSCVDSKWIFNSRWPNVKNFECCKLTERYQLPISIHRMLEAELEALIEEKKDLKQKSVCLVHWGYGIGAAYSNNGSVMKSNFGSTCEIGHLKTRHQNQRICKCNEVGCLETVSSGWSILPELGKQFGIFPEKETELSEKIKKINLSENIEIKYATINIAEAVDSIFRITFPDEIIAYGPFFSNDFVKKLFLEHVYKCIPYYARERLKIIVIEEDLSRLDPIGCTIDFFNSCMRKMLLAN